MLCVRVVLCCLRCESVVYLSCAVLFQVRECCVSELCCAVSGVRVFCIRVVLYCFRCESVLYQSCAVLFQVWPIKGGQWGTTAVSYPEIMITG